MSHALETPVWRVRDGAARAMNDRVAIERALEIWVRAGDVETLVTTTMRTPGQDQALALGFLFAEGVLEGHDAIVSIETRSHDAVLIELPAHAAAAVTAAERPFVTSAACGACGRRSQDGVAAPATALAAAPRAPRLTAAAIAALPASLRRAQVIFDDTGGLHAAGLFAIDAADAASGIARAVHEDVGRHNAVDKVVGTMLLAGALPLADTVLVVSGRASYELVQKAAAAGIPILAAVGAPSSLAVENAARAGMTLLGFVRDGGFNVYCGGDRLAGLSLGA